MNSQDIRTVALYLPHGERQKLAERFRCSKMTIDRALRRPRLQGYAAARHIEIRKAAIECGAYLRTPGGYTDARAYANLSPVQQ